MNFLIDNSFNLNRNNMNEEFSMNNSFKSFFVKKSKESGFGY